MVVAPSSTLANWERELNKWCPFLATVIFGGEKASRDAVKYDLQRYNGKQPTALACAFARVATFPCKASNCRTTQPLR